MATMHLIVLLMAGILCSSQPYGSSAWQAKTGAAAAPVFDNSVRVTIATGGGLHGPVKSQFKVGEDIPVVISLTNTRDQPAPYCLSTSLFQNRPQLKRNGQLLPYLTNLHQLVETEDAIQRCESSAARQSYDLQPKLTKVVDWFTISLRGIAWYEALPAGHYELVLMRRVDCCQGPWVESNKVTFDVVP